MHIVYQVTPLVIVFLVFVVFAVIRSKKAAKKYYPKDKFDEYYPDRDE